MGVTNCTSQGVGRIVKIMSIKCLAPGLACCKGSVVEPVSNREDLGKLPEGGGDISWVLKDEKDFSQWKGQENAPYL